MKLFLTSAGIVPEIAEEFFMLLGKNPKNTKMIFVPTAADPEKDKWFVDFVDKDRNHLTELGFKPVEIDLKKENEESLAQKIDGADIIYVEGGNTFYLLKYVRESGFAKVVKQFLDRGGVYVGVSAGSIIAGPNIDTANWEPADSNIVGLDDLSAMNLVSFSISPHYCDQVAQAIKETAAIVNYPVIALTDTQAVLVDGDKTRVVGAGERTIFNNSIGL